jgi:hypothetical protein
LPLQVRKDVKDLTLELAEAPSLDFRPRSLEHQNSSDSVFASQDLILGALAVTASHMPPAFAQVTLLFAWQELMPTELWGSLMYWTNELNVLVVGAFPSISRATFMTSRNLNTTFRFIFSRIR